MAIIYNNIQNMIWGNDGEFPLGAVIDRAKSIAKENKTHLKCIISTKRKEHKSFSEVSMQLINRNKDTFETANSIQERILNVTQHGFDGSIKIYFTSGSDLDKVFASFTRRLNVKENYSTELNNDIFSKEDSLSLFDTIKRCMNQCDIEEERIRVEIRTKAVGTTNSRQEHTFICDADSVNINLVFNAIIERITSSPSKDFSGEIRINFYQAGNATVKYGSFTRTINKMPEIEKPINKSLNWPFNFEDAEECISGNFMNFKNNINPENDYMDFDDYDEFDYNQQQGFETFVDAMNEIKEENKQLNKRIDSLIEIITNLTKG